MAGSVIILETEEALFLLKMRNRDQASNSNRNDFGATFNESRPEGDIMLCEIILEVICSAIGLRTPYFEEIEHGLCATGI